MRDFLSRHRRELILAVGMLLFLAAGLVVSATRSPGEPEQRQPLAPRGQSGHSEQSEKAVQAEQTEQKSAAKQAADGQLVLYITGAVPRPGVYKLGSGARVYNLAEAAGGLLPGASPAVNMAAVLQDGDHVHIPSRSEAKSVIAPVSTPAPTAPAGRSGGTAKTAKPEPEKTGLIDVNTASAEALVSVNGIGPSLAGRIIEYRTLHGPFNSVDELRKVKGIGAKTLEAIRGRLTVGR